MKFVAGLFEIIAGIFFPGPLILIPIILFIGGPVLIILCRKGEISIRGGWRLFFGSLILTGIAGYFYLDIKYPTYSWRQKLTIEVETPQGIVSGSSVVSVKWETVRSKPLTTAPGASFSIKGEATAVALPNGRYLFALLKGAEVFALHRFAEDKILHQYPHNWERYLPAAADIAKHKGETRILQMPNYPMLVTFGDINDPTSVKKVDPANLAEQFGPGVSLKSITMTITNEPVTTGKLEDVLAWWAGYENKQLDGDKYTDFYAKNRLANSLNRRDFKTGK